MIADLTNSRPPHDPKVGLEDAARPSPKHVFEERHYTVAEVSAMWKLSVDAVRKLFRNEPGVLGLGSVQRRGKRPYLTLRIPQSVLERVYRQKVLG
jgi:hypothetical protein